MLCVYILFQGITVAFSVEMWGPSLFAILSVSLESCQPWHCFKQNLDSWWGSPSFWFEIIYHYELWRYVSGWLATWMSVDCCALTKIRQWQRSVGYWRIWELGWRAWPVSAIIKSGQINHDSPDKVDSCHVWCKVLLLTKMNRRLEVEQAYCGEIVHWVLQQQRRPFVQHLNIPACNVHQ